jgi:hypothetical protein
MALQCRTAVNRCHYMFVRFRQSRTRLQASLIETRRVAGNVQHGHVTSLGAVSVPPSIQDRLRLWSDLPGRLARLSNRVAADDHPKIVDALHARIPMVTPDDLRTWQQENAEADRLFWTAMRDLNAEAAEGHKRVLATAEKKAAAAQVAVADADAKITGLAERLDQLKRGEDVAGGLSARATLAQLMRAIGWKPGDQRRARLLIAIERAGAHDMMMAEIMKRHRSAEKTAVRAVAKLIA